MLCVLPNVDASDLSINIQHKLIEAYCWENSVNVVKVGLYGHFLAITIVSILSTESYKIREDSDSVYKKSQKEKKCLISNDR